MTPKRIDRRVTDRLDKAEQRASAVPLKQNVSGGQVEVSLEGVCVEVRFDTAGVKTIDLPVALQSIPVHVEPMSLPELTPPGMGKKSSTLRVSAVNRSAWTHKQIQVQADDDGMDKTPFPCVQKFRVYPGPVPAATLSGSPSAGAASTLREQIGDAIINSPTTGQKAAMAGTDGTPSGTNRYVTDSDPRLAGAPPIRFSGGHADTVFDGTILMRVDCGGA